MAQGIENSFDLIPSEPFQPGWDEFLRHLPWLIQERRRTQREMAVIHGMVTHGVELPEVDGEIKDSMAHAVVAFGVGVGYPDVRTALEEGVGQGVGESRAEVVEKILVGDWRFSLKMPRRTVLRRCGTMINVKTGERVPVVFPHVTPVGRTEGGMGAEDGLYLGLSEGLEEVWKKLCDRYEELIAEDGDLDTQLRKMAFFQLIGCMLIHPFHGANGRAFNAHLVMELNRLGLEAREVIELGEVHPALDGSIFKGASGAFAQRFLQHFGMGLVTLGDFILFQREPSARDRYMRQLKVSIERAIEMDPNDANGVFYEFFRQVAEVIKLCTSRERLSDDGEFYEARAEELGREIRSALRAQIEAHEEGALLEGMFEHPDFKIRLGEIEFGEGVDMSEFVQNRSWNYEGRGRAPELKLAFQFDDPSLLDNCPFVCKVCPDKARTHRFFGVAYITMAEAGALMEWRTRFPNARLLTMDGREAVLEKVEEPAEEPRRKRRSPADRKALRRQRRKRR